MNNKKKQRQRVALEGLRHQLAWRESCLRGERAINPDVRAMYIVDVQRIKQEIDTLNKKLNME